jgi:MFS family permease
MTEALSGTFASLRRHRNYRLFFAGQAVSASGTLMQNAATAWLVLVLTGSPVAVGALVLCQFLPFTVLSVPAGVLVDRLDARRIVIATQALSMAVAVALAALTLGGAVEVWHVYVLSALRGAVLVFDAPGRQALTFQMVGRDELPNAVALNSSLFNASRIVGPAVGGIVIALAGVGWCFALNAASFLAVLAGLLAMRVDELVPLDREEPPTFVRGTLEAVRYVRRSRLTAVVLLTVLSASMLSFQFNTLLPVLARETLAGGAEVFGAVSAAFGGGALLGALVMAARQRAGPVALLVGTGAFGLAELLLAPLHSPGAVALLLGLAGGAYTVWTANANATLQLSTPDALRGRVIGLYFLAFFGSAPLGAPLAGWLAEAGGTELAFVVAGAAALVTTALAAGALGLGPRLVPARMRA